MQVICTGGGGGAVAWLVAHETATSEPSKPNLPVDPIIRFMNLSPFLIACQLPIRTISLVGCYMKQCMAAVLTGVTGVTQVTSSRSTPVRTKQGRNASVTDGFSIFTD
jgi:hypothetical protein